VPEIVGDAGILIKDPYSSSEISSALQLGLTILRLTLKKAGKGGKCSTRKYLFKG
jgi:hypothetical protein